MMIYQVTFETDQSFWSTKALADAEVQRLCELFCQALDLPAFRQVGVEGAERWVNGNRVICLDSWELDATPIDLLGD